MNIIMVLALVVLIVAGVVLMIRSDSPTWFLRPWRLHWAIWVIAAVLWGLMLTLF
ncbi:MAG TPA: hypothetical protein VJZ73_13975 [Methylomirabilota bacterium]|nr:hypothetical protein [Methylomirabilota bacterium]